MYTKFKLGSILIVLAYSNLCGQIALVSPNVSCFPHERAFYISGSLERAEDMALGGTLGFVIGRTVDIGIGIGKITSNDQLAQSLDLSAMHISPHVTFFPLSQSDVMPISIGLTGGYSAINFSSPFLEQANVSLKASDLNLQFNLFSNFNVSPITSFILGGSIIYISRTLHVSDGIGSDKITVSDLGFNIHGDFKFNNSGNNYFYFGPKLTVVDNTTSFALTAGVGFGSMVNKSNRSYRAGEDFGETFDDLEFTQLSNFRKATPQSQKYTDEQILAMFRRKYPNMRNKTDEELISLIEKKYKNRSHSN